MCQFVIPVSTIEDLTRRYRGHRIKTTKKLGGEEEFGKVAAAVVLPRNSELTCPSAVSGFSLGFLVETDSGSMEIWSMGILIPARQVPDGDNLIDDVQAGELTMEKFAQIVGVTLTIAEDLVKAHAKS